ncbi:response regulator [Staphylococcus aureus]
MTHLLRVVDDEQDIVETFVKPILNMKVTKVTTTTSGKEAISLLWDIDIMVLDIMMPEVNGYDTVKEMKRQKLDIPLSI